jgi:hypothetical protein
MLDKPIVIGQEVSLGAENPDWLLVDRTEGRSVRLRRSFGKPANYSAGFWIDRALVRAARWPVQQS